MKVESSVSDASKLEKNPSSRNRRLIVRRDALMNYGKLMGAGPLALGSCVERSLIPLGFE